MNGSDHLCVKWSQSIASPNIYRDLVRYEYKDSFIAQEINLNCVECLNEVQLFESVNHCYTLQMSLLISSISNCGMSYENGENISWITRKNMEENITLFSVSIYPPNVPTFLIARASAGYQTYMGLALEGFTNMINYIIEIKYIIWFDEWCIFVMSLLHW